MREIKFRAWVNNEIKKDVNPNRELYKSNEVLMQYTGLKDKSGVEIYEGDIVEAYRFKGEVVFVSGMFCLKWTDNKTGYRYPELSNHTNKVIGNIYENPELLK